MLQIKIKGQWADIGSGMSIEMNLVNPLFSDSFMNDGYSYSFELPLTSRNRFLVKGSFPAEIYISNVLFIRGTGLASNSSNDSVSVNLSTDANELKKQLQETQLNSLDMDEIQIWNTSDSAPSKSTKYQNHIESILNSNPKNVRYTFPPILTKGYKEFDPETDQTENENRLFASQGNTVNCWHAGNSVGNYGIPLDYDFPKSWINTIMPCPMVHYVLSQIIKHYNIALKNNGLDLIQEYYSLFLVHNYVMDFLEEWSFNDFGTIVTRSYNTHGQFIVLKNHVPKTNCFSIFQTLNELFDAYFVVSGNQMEVFIASKIINQAPVDMSKYTSQVTKTTTQDNKNFEYRYDVPDEILDTYSIVIDPDSGATENPYEAAIVEKTSGSTDEISVLHFPLQSVNQVMPDLYVNLFSYETEVPESYPEFAHLLKLQSLIFSAEIADENTSENDKVNIGLYRGIYQNKAKHRFSPYDVISYDFPYAYNFHKIRAVTDPIAESDINYVFGQYSIYQSGSRNIFDAYKRPKAELLSRSEIREKVLFLPVHELLKLMTWRQIRHTIRNRKESFSGYVKSLKFTLSNAGISPVTVEYLVPKEFTKGSFNDDYSNDFL